MSYPAILCSRNGTALSRTARAAGLALVASLSLWQVRADEFPAGCALADAGKGNTSTTGVNFNYHQAHLNDTVQVFPTLGMVGPALPQTGGACEAQQATGSVYITTGLLVKFLDNVTLDPGLIYQCPTNTTPPCTPGPYNIMITPALVGMPVTSPGGSINGVPNTVRAIQWSFSSHVRTGTPEETLDKLDTASISIVHPCIAVVKQCALPQGTTCFAPGANALFTGYVTNCGDINLTNVIAIDTRTGRLTLNDPVSGLPLATNASGGVTLAVSAYATYATSYTPSLSEFCAGATTNSVTVTGTDTSDIGCPNSHVTGSRPATWPPFL